MKKQDFSLLLLLAFIGAYAFGGGWYGAKISKALTTEPEQIVRERVIALQPIILERTIEKSITQPLQITLEGCGQPEQAAQAEEAAPADEEQSLEAEQTELPLPPAPPEAPPAYCVAPVAPGPRPAALFGLPTGITRPEPAAGDTSSLWELRKILGAGIRSGVELGQGCSPEYSGTLYGFWEFLRVRDTYVTAYAEANNDSTGKIQLDLQWRKP